MDGLELQLRSKRRVARMSVRCCSVRAIVLCPLGVGQGAGLRYRCCCLHPVRDPYRPETQSPRAFAAKDPPGVAVPGPRTTDQGRRSTPFERSLKEREKSGFAPGKERVC